MHSYQEERHKRDILSREYLILGKTKTGLESESSTWKARADTQSQGYFHGHEAISLSPGLHTCKVNMAVTCLPSGLW